MASPQIRKTHKGVRIVDKAVDHTVRKLSSGIFSFQEEAARFLLQHALNPSARVLLHVDTGLGKTIILRRLVELLKKPVVAVCPGQLVGQMAEALRRRPDGRGRAFRVIACETGKQLSTLATIDHDIAVVNTALNFWSKLSENFGGRYALAILDEAHLCGSLKLRLLKDLTLPIVLSSATPNQRLMSYATSLFKFTKLPHVVQALGMPQVSIRITRHPFPSLDHTEYTRLVISGEEHNSASIMWHPTISECSRLFALIAFGEFLIKRPQHVSLVSAQLLLQNGFKVLLEVLRSREQLRKDVTERRGLHRLCNLTQCFISLIPNADALPQLHSMIAPMQSEYNRMWHAEEAVLDGSFESTSEPEYNALVRAHGYARGMLSELARPLPLPPRYQGCTDKGFQRAIIRTENHSELSELQERALPEDVVPFWLTSNKSAGARRNIIKRFISFGGDMTNFLTLKRSLQRNVLVDPLVARVLCIGGGQLFFTQVGSFLFRRHVLICDQTVDVGLNLHRYVTSVCSQDLIPQYDALQQFASRVSRIAVDQEAQPSICVDMHLIEDTLEELFSAHVQAQCDAQKELNNEAACRMPVRKRQRRAIMS